jgi:subtilisin family serine protease
MTTASDWQDEMAIETFPLLPKASISLGLMAHQRKETRVRTAALHAAGASFAKTKQKSALTHLERSAVIVETHDAGYVADRVQNAKVTQLSEDFLSVEASVDSVVELSRLDQVRRVQTKKVSQLRLDAALPDIGLIAPQAGPRPVEEDGAGVLVGVIDSGFDLSHPMFRDSAGKLRVDRLLDQTLPGSREFTTDQLEREWHGGRGPGADEDGHGTHVASIAAGSRFGALEGVAPGARLLLVKTNLLDTADALSWVFSKAGNRPCVVNMSLGRHWGAHDGTDLEEKLHSQLTGPGRIIVVAAGNERTDDIHIGGGFSDGQTEEVIFDLQRQPDGIAWVVLNLYHDPADHFLVSLITPDGNVIAAPSVGEAKEETVTPVQISIARQLDDASNAIRTQISLQVAFPGTRELRGWGVRLTCRKATIGRIDGWFHNDGYATFRTHPLLENARTLGIPATGAGCLAVASHVTKTVWQSDDGTKRNDGLVVGRSSPFSSLGPTRVGGQKPDLSAPGQMVTAALASGSGLATDDRFASTGGQLLTIQGTSMAAPVVTGAVAMLLQQKPNRTLQKIRDILSRSVRRDAHTGPEPWDPCYGLGKLDIAAALRNR